MGDSFAVLAPRVEGSLYPFSAGLLGGSHRLPSHLMVYIGFQLVSTGYLPDDEVASLVPPQKSWDVRDQKAFYVECRITLQHSENHAPDCLHKLYLVIWQWTVCMPGLEWRVFKHANGVRDSQQNHESFLDIAGGKSDGHAEGPRMWYQIEAADDVHQDLPLFANSGNAPHFPVQERYPFSPAEYNLILLEGICLIESDKKWRRMMVYVLGNLLHDGYLGGLGPVQYIPSAPSSKQKVGKATLTRDYWAYPEQRDAVVTVTQLGSRVHRPSKESGWWAQGSTPAPSALPESQAFSAGFMEPEEAQNMMGGVPGLEAWERESPGEVSVGTDKPINDWRTLEEHLALSSEADTLPSCKEIDPPDHRQFSPPELPSSMRGYAASPTEDADESGTDSGTTTQTGGFTATRWTRPAVVPTLPAPVPSRSAVDQGCSQRRPLEMPPGLTEVSHPCKKGREALNYKVLRVLHTLHLTYMEHQTAVEKAQAAAAPWKAKLQNAWEDVPLPDAAEDEFESWLKKWDSMTNVEV